MKFIEFGLEIPCRKLNETMSCSTELTKIVIRLPKKYIVPPISPTVRMENLLNNVFVKRPAKLNALKNELVINVIALVSLPRLVKKSLNINPNDGILLKAQIFSNQNKKIKKIELKEVPVIDFHLLTKGSAIPTPIK